MAVYGRRRVGKTFLVRNYFKDQLVFEMTAVYGGTLKDQLKVFSNSLGGIDRLSREGARQPDHGFPDADPICKNSGLTKKSVVFLDEFPWFETRRSGFLGAFAHFWNTRASQQLNIIVVICGSAASWMIQTSLTIKEACTNASLKRSRWNGLIFMKRNNFNHYLPRHSNNSIVVDDIH